jgi:hypothetical protein
MKGGENMAVSVKPIAASFKVTNLQDKTIQNYPRFRADITAHQAEMFLEALGLIRGGLIGNGYLTVTTELAEA